MKSVPAMFNTRSVMKALFRWSAIVDGLDQWVGFGEVLSVVFDEFIGPLPVVAASLSALLRSTALAGEMTARTINLEAVANVLLSRTNLAGFVVHRRISLLGSCFRLRKIVTFILLAT